MQDFLNFIGFINDQLHTQRMPRLESLLMPASFSDIVSEFVASRLPAHCPDLVRNRHHNGRPDLLPKGFYADDAVLNGQEGSVHICRVCVSGSRRLVILRTFSRKPTYDHSQCHAHGLCQAALKLALSPLNVTPRA
jgi:hypothetical protein